MTLWTQVEHDGATAVVRLGGELDFAYRDAVVDAVRPELRIASNVILDLSELTFIDSSGLSALVKCRQAALESRCGFQLRGAAGHVLRVLKISGLENLSAHGGS